MNAQNKSVMVLGNCTNWSIAAAVRKSGLFSKVDSTVVFSMNSAEREEQAQRLEAYDKILTIEHSDSYGPLSTSALKANYNDKIVTMPTPFFSGLMPDIAYLNKSGQIARAEGAMGDYHSALILKECQDGLSCDEVVRRYTSEESFERLDILGIWTDSLNELKAREANTDVTLSDYIESQTKTGGIVHDFLTMNHPSEGLINHIARKFVALVAGTDLPITPLKPAEHTLNAGSRWPLRTVVSTILGLPVDSDATFRCQIGGKVETFSIAEFARRSYEYFCVQNTPDNFQISTPSYILKHFK